MFHVAHPVDVSTNLNDEADVSEETITQTSLGGMLGILKICTKSRTVKRVVVYTSSTGTIMFNGKTAENGDANEDSWTDLEVCNQSSFGPKYLVSKTITEKKGIRFCGRERLDMVSLVLPLVVGLHLPFRAGIRVPSHLLILQGNQKSWRRFISLKLYTPRTPRMRTSS